MDNAHLSAQFLPMRVERSGAFGDRSAISVKIVVLHVDSPATSRYPGHRCEGTGSCQCGEKNCESEHLCEIIYC